MTTTNAYPLAWRVLENALRTSGYFIARREPISQEETGELIGTMWLVTSDAHPGRRAFISIRVEDEDDEAIGWRKATFVVRQFAALAPGATEA